MSTEKMLRVSGKWERGKTLEEKIGNIEIETKTFLFYSRICWPTFYIIVNEIKFTYNIRRLLRDEKKNIEWSQKIFWGKF